MVVSTTVHVPESLGDRLAAEAARRGVTVDELSAKLLAAGLGQPGSSASSRRHLAFAAIGASGTSRGAEHADELLADGFGRD